MNYVYICIYCKLYDFIMQLSRTRYSLFMPIASGIEVQLKGTRIPSLQRFDYVNVRNIMKTKWDD